MTNFQFPTSDREKWGLRGAVWVCTELCIPPGTAPADLFPESRIEFTREGMRVGKVDRSDATFGIDQAGRKVRVRVSRPEDYVMRSAGGSPFSIADRRPNLPGGGTATTYYDDSDRPVEVQIRSSQDEVVSSAVRVYDHAGRVTEERLTIHSLAAYIPTALSSNDTVNEWLKSRGSSHSVEFFYDSGIHPTRTVRRDHNKEDVVVTSYNEHGDPEVEITTSKNMVDGNGEAPSLHWETRYSYQYDERGNWTERVVASRSGEERAFTTAMTYKRTLEYFTSLLISPLDQREE